MRIDWQDDEGWMKDDDPFKKYPFLSEKNGGDDEISENNRDNKIKDQHNKWILTPQGTAVQPQIVHTLHRIFGVSGCLEGREDEDD